jgi:hypothetical protein
LFKSQQIENATAELRAAYAAFNRGDIDGTVRFMDPGIEWIEPAEFSGGGTYHGVEGAKQYLAQSRAGESMASGNSLTCGNAGRTMGCLGLFKSIAQTSSQSRG